MDKKDDFKKKFKKIIKNYKLNEIEKNKILKQHFSKGSLNLETVNLDHLIEKK